MVIPGFVGVKVVHFQILVILCLGIFCRLLHLVGQIAAMIGSTASLVLEGVVATVEVIGLSSRGSRDLKLFRVLLDDVDLDMLGLWILVAKL